MKDIELADSSRATVITETIKESKIGITPAKKDLIMNAKLFKFENGVKSIKESEGRKIEEVFEGSITEKLVTNTDYSTFAQKVGIEENQLAMNKKKAIHEHTIAGVETMTPEKSFKNKKKIKKWR